MTSSLSLLKNGLSSKKTDEKPWESIADIGGEDALLARMRRWCKDLPAKGVAQGMGDDAAVIRLGDSKAVAKLCATFL